MSNVKVVKKGETLYKEGEKAGSVYLIQSGSVSLTLKRQKANIDLCTLGSNQVAGEHALSGAATHPHTAVAMAETKYVELPLEAVKGQVEGGTQILKFLLKGMADKLKVVMKEFQSLKLERDPSPCPPDQTAKIFATVYHCAKTKGEAKKDGVLTVSWPLMKQYGQRMFLESPKRLEMAVNIFVKLQIAKYEMVKDPDDPEAPEQIGFVHFTDLTLLEQFFEFFAYYHFKGGKQELLKTDDRVILIVQGLFEAAKGEPLDRHGAVRLDYTKLVEQMKASAGIQLNSDHFTMLESKGLFVKRQSTDDGVFIHFDFKEFERTARVWKVLREVERWNDKGFVDPNEPVVEVKKAQKAGPACPKCDHPFEGAAKFCSECGTKLQQAA